MKKRTRTVLIVGGIVVALGLIVVGNVTRRPTGETVDTKKVGYGKILSKVSATGELEAQTQVNLQAQIVGTVAKLHVAEGDFVHRGDVLLELDRRSHAANLALARARYDQAQLSFSRIESLYQARLVSAENYEAAKANYEMALAQLEQAQDQFDKTTLLAPISGTVAQVNIKEGETVLIGTMNNPGTVLMVIADMSRMRARVNVNEADIVTVIPGQRADIRVDAIPDSVFAGQVTKVSYMPSQPLLTTTTDRATTFEVEITIDSVVASLRPGMTVRADIITAELDSVLIIPIQAAGRREYDGRETETVFLVRDGKAVLVPIRTGRASDTDIEVLDGVKSGDEVIIGPYKTLTKLTDGRRVLPRLKTDSAATTAK